MNYYYKVLQKRNNKYYSAVIGRENHGSNGKHAIEYYLHKHNFPTLRNSKLMIFNNLPRAVCFANGEAQFCLSDTILVICECVPANVAPQMQIALLDEDRINNVENFWSNYKSCSSLPAPDDSYGCDSLYLCNPIVFVRKEDF